VTVALWTIQDLAEFLKTTPATIYGLRYRREGPAAIRVGKELRFDPADVRAWLDSRKEQARSVHLRGIRASG
jgi:predicted DNA-binding transcriptional regulator AlpA